MVLKKYINQFIAKNKTFSCTVYSLYKAMLGVHRNMDHVLHVIESFYFLTQTIVYLDPTFLI